MGKNIVIFSDGTGSQIDPNPSNVLKLYRILEKDKEQVVFYDPGMGTIGDLKPWFRARQWINQKFRGATGSSIDNSVLAMYSYLIDHYEDGDNIYLFGYSRGAYAVRVLAGLIYAVGLLKTSQKNLCEYALGAFRRSGEQNEQKIVWEFSRALRTRQSIPIRFIGVWDTVSSVFAPARSLEVTFPYDSENPAVEYFRHAIAIDEPRYLFRVNKWVEPQIYKPNPFDEDPDVAQNIKQVWFCGGHGDVGGGRPEEESGLSKITLKWMADEAKVVGLKVDTAMYNHHVLGKENKASNQLFVAPSAIADMKVEERHMRWSGREMEDGAFIHSSVFERMKAQPDYTPKAKLPHNYKEVE